MWLLLYLILDSASGLTPRVLLERYPSEQRCRTAQMRVAADMAEAYPGDETFQIACEWRPLWTRPRPWRGAL